MKSSGGFKKISFIKTTKLLYLIFLLLICQYCYAYEPDYRMKIFEAESIFASRASRDLNLAKWTFKITDKQLIIEGALYKYKIIHGVGGLKHEWQTSHDIKIIETLLLSLQKGKEWTAVAKKNNIKEYTKKINCFDSQMCIYFHFNSGCGYVNITSNAWDDNGSPELKLEYENNDENIRDVDELIQAFDNYKERYINYKNIQKNMQDDLYRSKIESEKKLKKEKEKIDNLFK